MEEAEAAADSVEVAAGVQAENAIAGKRYALIEYTKGCHDLMAPFFYQSNHSSPVFPPVD